MSTLEDAHQWSKDLFARIGHILEFPMNDIAVIEARIVAVRKQLIEVQMKQQEDSKILNFNEVMDRWCSGPAKNEAAFSLAHAGQYPVKVFYECGLKPDGTYRHRGCRYGFAPHQYLSGFGSYGV